MTCRADGRWQEVLTIDGKKKYFYGKTKAAVLAKIRAFESSRNSTTTFAAVAERWQGQHREEIGDKTWTNYKPHYNDIVSQHGKRDVSEITTLDVVNDLKRAKAQGFSATVISTRRSIYRMILDFALLEGIINYNPALAAQMPKNIRRTRREAVTDDVIAKILTNTDKPFGLFPMLLLCTGLRRSEALALTWEDVKDDHIVVNKALDYTNHAHPVVKSPKTAAGVRDVPLLDILKPFLIRPEGAKDSDLLFPAAPCNRKPTATGHMTEKGYEWAWQRYCELADLVDENNKPVFTAHQLRHSMATQLFQSGADELTAQLILGHASPTTTRNIYTHLTNQQKAQSVSKLNDIMSEKMSKLV